MTKFGDIRSVLLYRDLDRDRWRWTVYDSEGTRDGWLPGVSAEVTQEDAAVKLEQLVLERWRQRLDSEWIQDKPDSWSAGRAST